MRQRLALASALLGDPGVLILDEPANGLDPEGIRWLRDLLRSLAAEGRAVLISSHVLAEVEQTVDEVVIINKGKFVAHGSIESLTRSVDGRVRVRSPQAAKLEKQLAKAGLEGRARRGRTARRRRHQRPGRRDRRQVADRPARADSGRDAARGCLLRAHLRGAEVIASLSSEWLKIRTTRTIFWLLVALAALITLFAVANVLAGDKQNPRRSPHKQLEPTGDRGRWRC